MKLTNINQPTSPKWVKIGTALLTCSAFIGTYSLTAQVPFVGYLGLGLGLLGTMIIAFKD